MVLATYRINISRLQHCNYMYICNLAIFIFGKCIKVFAGCRLLFSKSSPALRRRQNLKRMIYHSERSAFLMACCQKCFCVTLDKSNRTVPAGTRRSDKRERRRAWANLYRSLWEKALWGITTGSSTPRM